MIGTAVRIIWRLVAVFLIIGFVINGLRTRVFYPWGLFRFTRRESPFGYWGMLACGVVAMLAIFLDLAQQYVFPSLRISN
jgi:hypothetical protein